MLPGLWGCFPSLLFLCPWRIPRTPRQAPHRFPGWLQGTACAPVPCQLSLAQSACWVPQPWWASPFCLGAGRYLAPYPVPCSHCHPRRVPSMSVCLCGSICPPVRSHSVMGPLLPPSAPRTLGRGEGGGHWVVTHPCAPHLSCSVWSPVWALSRVLLPASGQGAPEEKPHGWAEPPQGARGVRGSPGEKGDAQPYSWE